jgi:hypothetical protein
MVNFFCVVQRYTGVRGTDGADGDITWQEDWTSQNYTVNQAVSYQGSSYVCKLNTVSSEVPTDTTYWSVLASKGDTGDGATGVPMVQAYNATDHTLAASWSILDFDTTHVESAPSEISHDPVTNNSRIYVHSDGIYEVAVQGTLVFTDSGDDASSKCTLNASPTAISGSEFQLRAGNESGPASADIIPFSRSFLIDLSDGDYVQWLVEYPSSGGGELESGRLFTVKRYVGQQGIQGIQGIQGPIGSSVPTADSYGYNTETLAGDKTLTDSSDTVLFINPGGADRVVNLPVLTVDTPFFLIVHTGTADRLILTLDEGQILKLLEVGESVRVWTDGTTMYASEFTHLAGPTAGGKLSYIFSGSVSVAGYQPYANGYGQRNIKDYLTEHVVNVDGTLDFIGYHLSDANNSVFRLWKNGSSYITLGPTSTTEGTFAPALAVVAGDQISIEYESGSSVPNVCNFHMLVTPTSGVYSTYSWGSSMTSISYYAQANGGGNDTQQGTITEEAEFTIIEACKADSLTWGTQSSATTTVMKLWKNGAVAESISLGAAQSGVTSGLTTYLDVGDTIALEYDSGSTTGNSVFTLAVSGTSGVIYRFGGDASTSTTSYYEVSALANDGLGTTLYTIAEAVVPACTLKKMSVRRGGWNVDTETFQIWKNGANSSEEALSGLNPSYEYVVNFGTPVTFALGDRLAIRDVNSANSGDSIISVLLEV